MNGGPMLQRFVSAVVVPGVLIALGAVVLYAVAHTYTLENPYRVALLWCVVPMVWGVWALLAPKSWWPGKLPAWGGLLGLVASSSALFVLKVPDRVANVTYSTAAKLVGVVIMTLFYALLWMVVGEIYRRLMSSKEEHTLKAMA